MDDRQQQLVAAAEALRKWVRAQQALWVDGYHPAALHPQLAAAGAAAAPALPAVLPVPSVPDFALEPVQPVPEEPVEVDAPPRAIVSPALAGAAALLKRSWRFAAAAVAIVAVALTVRAYWGGVREKVVSNLAAGRDAVRAQTQALSQRVTGSRREEAAGDAAGPAPTDARLQIDSNPSGAHVLIDGRDRGTTPLAVDGLAPGSHKVQIRADAGTVQRTVSVAAGETVQLSEAIYSGWLHVAAPIEVRLSEGRRAITLDDSNQVLLAPGPHDIRVENRTLGVNDVRHVEIRPGETTVLTLDTPHSKLTVTSSEPATVSIDGQPAGSTPLADFLVPVGTRELAVTSAAGVVRRQTLTVTMQSQLVDVDFSKR
jgi:hypothetical protein